MRLCKAEEARCWKCEVPVGADAEEIARALIVVETQDSSYNGAFIIKLCFRCATSARDGVSAWRDRKFVTLKGGPPPEGLGVLKGSGALVRIAQPYMPHDFVGVVCNCSACLSDRERGSSG